jgi:hypothetical protein
VSLVVQPRCFVGMIGMGFMVEESEVGELTHQGLAVPLKKVGVGSCSC